jgi:glycosyltransferase involved in cell wall biosynthesis
MSAPTKKSILELCAVEFTYVQFLSVLASKLSRSGWEVKAAFSSSNPSQTLIRLNQDSVCYCNLNVYRSAKPVKFVKSLCSLMQLLRQDNSSIIHVHTPVVSYIVRLIYNLGCFNSSKLVCTVHGYYFHSQSTPLTFALHYFAELFLTRPNHYYLFVSKEDYKFASNYLPVSAKRSFYVGNGVDTKLFLPYCSTQSQIAKYKKGLTGDDVVIGFVGRLVKEKGLIELLQAFTMLSRVIPALKLLICGDTLESDYDTSLSNLIKKSIIGSHRRIIATGMVNSKKDLIDCYNCMDIFCLPSYREGLPTSLLEAMSCGLPCVATDIRGCNELIEHGETGLLVQPKNSQSLASALHRLIVDRELRQLMGKRARANIVLHYDIEDILFRQTKILSLI